MGQAREDLDEALVAVVESLQESIFVLEAPAAARQAGVEDFAASEAAAVQSRDSLKKSAADLCGILNEIRQDCSLRHEPVTSPERNGWSFFGLGRILMAL